MPANGTLKIPLQVIDGIGCRVALTPEVTAFPFVPMGLRDTTVCSSSDVLDLTAMLNRVPDPIYFRSITGTALLNGISPSWFLSHFGVAGRNILEAYHTDEYGCIRRDTGIVEITALPEDGIRDAMPSVCEGQGWYNLRKASGLQLAGGRWWLNGQPLAADSFRLDNLHAGMHQVHFELNYGGCYIEHNLSLQVLPKPTLQVSTYLPTAVCGTTAGSIELRATPLGGIWSGTRVNDGKLYYPVGEGSYRATYSYSNPVTGCANHADYNVAVEMPVRFTGFPGLSASLCDGEKMEFSVETRPGTLINALTNHPDGLKATSPGSYTFSGIGEGRNLITLTAGSVNVCPDRDTTVEIIVFPVPSGLIQANANWGCTPFELDLQVADVYPPAPEQVLWLVGDRTGLQNSLNHKETFSERSTFLVQVEIVKNGCRAMLTMADSIRISESPLAAFEIVPGRVLDMDYPVASLRNTSTCSEPFSSRWYIAGQLTGWQVNETSPVVNFHEPDDYTVKLIVQTDAGCMGYKEDQIRVNDRVKYFVPNAFTPDNRGPEANEVFMPILADEVGEFEFCVFNRWGEKMFGTNKPGVGWPGITRGQLTPAGPYAWSLRFVTLSGKEINDSGIVLLMH
jgi:hypothetical protein